MFGRFRLRSDFMYFLSCLQHRRRTDHWWRTAYKCTTDLHRICNWKMKIHRNQASWIKLCARSALDFILGSGYDIIFAVCELNRWRQHRDLKFNRKKNTTENQFFARNRICFAVFRGTKAQFVLAVGLQTKFTRQFRLEWVEKISENLDTF